jgi:hypothetical protein
MKNSNFLTLMPLKMAEIWGEKPTHPLRSTLSPSLVPNPYSPTPSTISIASLLTPPRPPAQIRIKARLFNHPHLDHLLRIQRRNQITRQHHKITTNPSLLVRYPNNIGGAQVVV